MGEWFTNFGFMFFGWTVAAILCNPFFESVRMRYVAGACFAVGSVCLAIGASVQP